MVATEASAVLTGSSRIRMVLHSVPVRQGTQAFVLPHQLFFGLAVPRLGVMQFPEAENYVLCERQLWASCTDPEERIWIEHLCSHLSFLPGFPVALLRRESRQVTEGSCPVRPINSIMLHITTIYVTTPNGKLWIYPCLCWPSNYFSLDIVLCYFSSFLVLYFLTFGIPFISLPGIEMEAEIERQVWFLNIWTNECIYLQYILYF